MGWISKIFSALEETPNAINRTLDMQENLKTSTDKVATLIAEKNRKKALDAVQELQDTLSRVEASIDAQYNQALGRINEEKIQILDEHKIELEYTVACKYNSIHYAGSNMYVVKLYEKYGVVLHDDTIIIPIEYDFIVDYSESKFCACKDGKWGFIDINNNVIIDFVYEDANSFSEGLAPVSTFVDGKELYGYIDSWANVVIPYKYDLAEPFTPNKLACVGIYDPARRDMRKGVINNDDRTIVNCNYSIIEIEDDYIAYASEPFHSLKFFDLKGVQIDMVEPKKEPPKNIIIPYFNSQMLYGYYVHTDDGDTCKIVPTFENAYCLNSEGYAIVKKDGLYGIIDLNEKQS